MIQEHITLKKFFFSGSTHELAAHLVLPSTSPCAYAVYVHCFTCSKDHHASRRITTELAYQGIATLRFDLTGLGESKGDFSHTSFATNVEDIHAAVLYLKENYGSPQLIIGHSLGGTAALIAATQLPGIRGVVTLNSPYDPAHVAKRVISVKEEVMLKGEAEVLIEGRLFKIQKTFFEALENYNMAAILPTLNAALLVMHAPADSVVNIRNANQIFTAAPHPKSFISLGGMDHLLTKQEDATYIASIIKAWASRYIIN